MHTHTYCMYIYICILMHMHTHTHTYWCSSWPMSSSCVLCAHLSNPSISHSATSHSNNPCISSHKLHS